MINRIDKLIQQKENFAFETTLSSKSILRIIEKAKTSGYKIDILFFYLNSYQIAIQRVKERVKQGGHNIPREVIMRRYRRGIINLINTYKNICDYCMIANNSGTNPKIIAEIKNNSQQIISIHSEADWHKINIYAKNKKQ